MSGIQAALGPVQEPNGRVEPYGRCLRELGVLDGSADTLAMPCAVLRGGPQQVEHRAIQSPCEGLQGLQGDVPGRRLDRRDEAVGPVTPLAEFSLRKSGRKAALSDVSAEILFVRRHLGTPMAGL